LSLSIAMLNDYPRALIEGLSGCDLVDQTWIDLVDPTEAERSAFERASGLRVPSKNEVGEIEATSRLQIKNDALYMTAPMIFAAENEPWFPTPVGFVLSKQLLMTVRFASSVAFDTVAKETSAADNPGSGRRLRASPGSTGRSPRRPPGIG
jgi:magnesium transporter